MQKVTALIHRDVTSQIPAQVFAHELAILEVIHGGGKIELVDGSAVDIETDHSPEEEYTRLELKYGIDTDAGVTHVSKVYRNISELAEAMGVEVEAPRAKKRAAKPAAGE
jgi:hypothetical protein